MAFKSLPLSDEAVELHARKCLAFAQVAKAWETAVNRARILRGRPLPGSLRPKTVVKPQRRVWRPPVPVELMEAPAPSSPAVPADAPTQQAGCSPPPTAGGERSTPQPASPATAAKAPPDAPCQACRGTGQVHNSNFGVDLACTACKGTGRLPAPKA